MFSVIFGLSNQEFQSFQLFLCVLFAETDPNAGNRDAHFQQAVIDAGMGCILWVPYLVQRQVGGDDQRLPAAVSAVHDVVDLFQRILCAALRSISLTSSNVLSARLTLMVLHCRDLLREERGKIT